MILIDVNKLKENLTTEIYSYSKGDIRKRLFARGLSLAYDIVNRQPTVEPKHGHWGYVGHGLAGESICKCSICGHQTPDDGNYCSYCGAKMDENEWEEPEINPCRGCVDYDGRGGCKSNGGCGAEMDEVME